MDIAIRPEAKEDYEVTGKVVKSAFAEADFSDKKEHELVARIRESSAFIPELSLLAIDKANGLVIGHILLSKITIEDDEQREPSLALAPVSVLPVYQNKGVGSRLIISSIEKATEMGFQSVIVLGHSDYYPRFGFQKASSWGIKAPFDVPDEVFMAKELQEGALDGVSGVVEYPQAFHE